ncbi:MAG: OmpH family outer membrane protein [Gammaproteobacteria bacterium]|nr:OmpH family outer membrane protein [Gammaproteobacteria bacterium]NND39471.1 OmpH family outer membrane protein [Pseudomonadales bacterium]MBT8151235.1 OmpH family outer membrane protein [Gammaproteobacteria bacterium]NNL10363.1 OmpH family outer membrane protein [Pseudomonadales bacterium]NNM12659.1 OmpH family outer membrane protein [Pseudomonadales bacterium]
MNLIQKFNRAELSVTPRRNQVRVRPWFALSPALVALLLALVLQPLQAYAQNAPKIAVVDVQRAVLQTESVKKKLEQFKKKPEFKENFKELESLEKEYKKLLDRYEKDRAVMSDEKREGEKRKILEKQQDMKYVASKLQQVRDEFLERILQERAADTQKVLEGLVREQAIGLLLNARAPAVMHADASYDLSDQVTERLNAIK